MSFGKNMPTFYRLISTCLDDHLLLSGSVDKMYLYIVEFLMALKGLYLMFSLKSLKWNNLRKEEGEKKMVG